MHAGRKFLNYLNHQIICLFPLVSEICEWVMESVQEKKELSTVPGTVPFADGRPDEQGQSPIRLTYIETNTHIC